MDFVAQEKTTFKPAQNKPYLKRLLIGPPYVILPFGNLLCYKWQRLAKEQGNHGWLLAEDVFPGRMRGKRLARFGCVVMKGGGDKEGVVE